MIHSQPSLSCPLLLFLCHALHWLHSNFTWTGLVHKYCSASAMMKVRFQKQWRKLWKCTAFSTSILGNLLLDIFVEQYIRNTKMRQRVANFSNPAWTFCWGSLRGACNDFLGSKRVAAILPPFQMRTLALYFNNLAKNTFWLKLFKL